MSSWFGSGGIKKAESAATTEKGKRSDRIAHLESKLNKGPAVPLAAIGASDQDEQETEEAIDYFAKAGDVLKKQQARDVNEEVKQAKKRLRQWANVQFKAYQQADLGKLGNDIEYDELGFEGKSHVYGNLGALAAVASDWDKRACSGYSKSFPKDLLRAGVPLRQRPNVWYRISGAKSLAEAPDARRFEAYAAEAEHKIDDKDALQIEADLHRTFPSNKYFSMGGHKTALQNRVNVQNFSDKQPKALLELRKILTAYCIRNPKIRYCQGMNFVAGFAYLVTEDTEKSFWIMAAIVELLVPEYFSEGMTGVMVDTEVTRALVLEKLDSTAHFLQKLPFLIICSNWFLTLFVGNGTSEFVMRIWDAFLNEGSKVLLRIAVALFKTYLPDLRIIADSDVDVLCTEIKDLPTRVKDIDALFKTAFKDIGSLPSSKVEKLRAKERSAIAGS
eukprot:Clim_evm62s25 gene=Clim_evmTU62s25